MRELDLNQLDDIELVSDEELDAMVATLREYGYTVVEPTQAVD